MILCAGNIESFDFATPIGIGLVEAAMNVTRLCLFDKPEYLLFIGSAGSYGDFGLLELVESKTAANIELSMLQNQSYTPLDNVVSSYSGSGHDAIVNSSNYITTDAALAQKMLGLGVGIENMEFFAVMRVAQEFGISAGGLFCITNYCDAQAHSDFLKNHEAAKAKLSLHVKARR
ncbi:MAG: purine-nucleoside phosphorylase [Campylobacterales bacterium]|nr:purine-nucleoside phosphorylase [Campylobacterales bacterium]